MMAAWWCFVATCWAAGALGAVTPGRHFNLPATEDAEPGARGRQLYYLPQAAPQLQRLELAVDNADAQYYQPNQQRQDVQTFSANEAEKETKSEETPAKLETLEPDAELIPGAQQGQQPQGPPTQVPVAPPAGIPGLLPGQRFYIVHPQHQIYQNPLYPGLPNGFRPNIQVPGFQRFYLVQGQPTVGDGGFAAQAGYQNAILVDPSGQPLAPPQYLQPNYQRLVASEAPQKYRGEPNQNYAAPNQNNAPLKEYQQSNKNFADPATAYQQQQIDFGAAQRQFAPAFSGPPPATLPFLNFGRQIEIPYQQGLRSDLQLNPNAVQFSQLLSLQQSQYGAAPGQLTGPAPPPPAPPAPQQAQGRNDYDYREEERNEETSPSKEKNDFDESPKNNEDKSSEPGSEDAKSGEDTEEIMITDRTATTPKAAVNPKSLPKPSNKQK